MPQSCANILLHFVWSTKDRRALIPSDVRPRLHAYLAETVRASGCGCSRVGGTNDHVHLAVGLSRTVTVAKLVNDVKSNSSRWMSVQTSSPFAWQHGYGVFSVWPRDLDKLAHYIDAQEEHHRMRSFQEEYRALLVQYGVPFDEPYVWIDVPGRWPFRCLQTRNPALAGWAEMFRAVGPAFLLQTFLLQNRSGEPKLAAPVVCIEVT